MDGQDRRHGGEAAGDRARRPHPQDAARGAAVSPPLRRGLVDGDPMVRLSSRQAGRIGPAAVVGKICAHGDIQGSIGRTRPARGAISLALCRGPHHRRSDERARLPRDRRLRQAGHQAAGRAAAARGAVEVRLQVDQIDRALQFHRPAPEELLGGAAGLRVRLLGQRQSGSVASALEPGDRGADRPGRAPPDAAVQRLWRLRRRPLQGAREGAAVGVSVSSPDGA